MPRFYSRFIQAGCSKVYLLARSRDTLDEAVKALEDLKTPNKHPQTRAIPIVCDVSSADDLARAAAEVAKTTSHVNILLANAGATFIGQLEDYKQEDFANVMRVNVDSVFFTIQKLAACPTWLRRLLTVKCFQIYEALGSWRNGHGSISCHHGFLQLRPGDRRCGCKWK